METKYNNEGYVWLSDRTEPCLIEKFSKETDGTIVLSFSSNVFKVKETGAALEMDGEEVKIPFVVESYFVYENHSYSVRMIDGQYRVAKVDLTQLDKVEVSEVSFVPNRFGEEISKLKFLGYWKEQSDPLCEGMNVLVPAEDVFVGFEKVYSYAGQ